jgi:hypothetical protein
MWPLLAITDYYRTTCVHRATPALRILSHHEWLQRAIPVMLWAIAQARLGLAGTPAARGGGAASDAPSTSSVKHTRLLQGIDPFLQYY